MESGQVTIIQVIKNLSDKQWNRLMFFGTLGLFMFLYFNNSNKGETSCQLEIKRLIDDKAELQKRVVFLENLSIDVIRESKKEIKESNIEKDTTIAVLKRAVIKLSK